MDETYEAPKIERMGTLQDLTKSTNLPNADELFKENTANPVPTS